MTSGLASCLEREPLVPFLSCDKYKKEKHLKDRKRYYAFVDLLSPRRGGEMGFAEAGCG